MTLPSSGPISMGQVRTELGGSGAINMGSTAVRSLAGKPSGTIALSDLRGKTYVPPDKTVNISLFGGYFASGYGDARYGFLEGSIGAISPNTYMGYRITQLDLYSYNGIYTLTILFANGGTIAQTVKAVTIGGIRITDLLRYNLNPQQKTQSSVIAYLSLEGFNAIANAIYNKSSTVAIEYF